MVVSSLSKAEHLGANPNPALIQTLNRNLVTFPDLTQDHLSGGEQGEKGMGGTLS